MSGHAGRKRRGGHEEEHENHERWLVSYADMLTLLFALFIVLFAMGQMDERKYAALKEGLSIGFDSTPAVASQPRPAKTVLDSGPQAAAAPELERPTPPDNKKETAEQAKARAAAKSAYEHERQGELMAEAETEVNEFAELQKQITKALAQKGMQDSVQFKVTERGLVITVVTDEVIFSGDSSTLRPAGARVLDAIAPPLRPTANQISVEGHTNHLGPGGGWTDSWELSSARAVSVVRYLSQQQHIQTGRLQATGFGKQRPLYPVKDARAITLNRRVEVVVLSTLPAEAKALLPAAAATTATTATTHD